MTLEASLSLATLLLFAFQAGGLVMTVKYLSKQQEETKKEVKQHAERITRLEAVR